MIACLCIFIVCMFIVLTQTSLDARSSLSPPTSVHTNCTHYQRVLHIQPILHLTRFVAYTILYLTGCCYLDSVSMLFLSMTYCMYTTTWRLIQLHLDIYTSLFSYPSVSIPSPPSLPLPPLSLSYLSISFLHPPSSSLSSFLPPSFLPPSRTRATRHTSACGTTCTPSSPVCL